MYCHRVYACMHSTLGYGASVSGFRNLSWMWSQKILQDTLPTILAVTEHTGMITSYTNLRYPLVAQKDIYSKKSYLFSNLVSLIDHSLGNSKAWNPAYP